MGPFQLVERLDLWRDIGLYRAMRPAGSRAPQAVAIRLAEDPRDERAGAWVRHEYDILRVLDDPRVPRAFGYYSSQVAVAQSFVDGVALSRLFELRRQGALTIDPATAADLLTEIAGALRHAHAVVGPDGPVVHGHLCPEQIVLRRDGQVFVMGFGGAPRALQPGYTPPELAAGAFLDPRTDQWSLGALAVELFLGNALYTGVPDPGEAAVEGRVEPWLRRLEQRAGPAARLARRLLAPAAGDRFAGDGDLTAELLACGRELGGRADRVALISTARARLAAELKREAEARSAADADALRRAAEVAAAPARPAPGPAVSWTRAPEIEEEPTLPPAAHPERAAGPDPLVGPIVGPVVGPVDGPSFGPSVGPTAGPLGGRAEPSFSVPERDPEDAPSLGDLVVLPAPDAVAPPPIAPPEPVDDDPSLGLGRLGALPGGPSLSVADPGADPTLDPTLDPADPPPPAPRAPLATPMFDEEDPAELEVTEQISPVDPGPAADEAPRVPSGPRADATAWQPSELAAMASIVALVIVGIAFLLWRFG